MAFEELHTVTAGENMSRIAKARGFDNPGPIAGYPGNQALFRSRSSNLLRPGERILIPYHPDVLLKIIATSELLIGQITADTTRLIQSQDLEKKDIEEFLFKIDAANMLASIGVGIGTLIAKGPGATMSSKEAIAWLVESRVNLAANIATAAIPAPSAPRKDFKFFVRHTLGPWNPSFWASVYAAIKEGDVDVYLYGTDATTHHAKLKIKQQADADIQKLRRRAAEAQAQIKEPYYRKRI